MTQPVRKKISKFFFYIVLGLSVLAMVGFGITGIFSPSTTANVATVGDEDVTAEEYFRVLQQELQTLSQQVGQNITIEQALQFGIDQQVLQRLITQAAIRGEVKRLGISVSDETVRKDLLENPMFQGLGGAFDKDLYKDIVTNSGLSPSEYEDLLRMDAAQVIMQTAITAGVALPDAALDTVFDYMGETRNFTYAGVTPENLPVAAPEPDEAELIAFYAAHPEEFTQPLTREITYVSLTPEQVAESAEVGEEAISALYESRADQYNTRPRRFVERIAFGTADEAAAAMARIESGEANFDDLLAEAGLTVADADMGDVTPEDVGSTVADVLFATDEPGVYGPLESDIGPAIFRLNAAIDGTSIPLEEVRDELKHEIALGEAAGTIADIADEVIDLIAGGATLEEVADETPLTLETIALPEGGTDGIAAYAEFRDEASAAEIGEERDVVEMSDGGIFALRVDNIVEPHVLPFEEVRDEILAKWKAAKTKELIQKRAEQIASAIEASGGSLGDFAGALQIGEATEIARTANVPDLPPAVIPAVFEMEPGEVRIFENVDGAVIVQLNSVKPFDPEDERAKPVVDQVTAQANDLLAQDILTYFSAALVQQAEPTLNQARIDALYTQLQ